MVGVVVVVGVVAAAPGAVLVPVLLPGAAPAPRVEVVAGVVAVPGLTAPGVLAAPGAADAPATLRTVVSVAGAGPEPRASFTSAAAKTATQIAASTSSSSRGGCQRGVAATRVRAAAPQ